MDVMTSIRIVLIVDRNTQNPDQVIAQLEGRFPGAEIHVDRRISDRRTTERRRPGRTLMVGQAIDPHG